MNVPAARFPVRALTACLLGLAVCPWSFIAIGALSHFPTMFSVVMLPPFVLGCGFLLFRYLSGTHAPRVERFALLVIEGLSWLTVAVFLFFVSSINLATRFERVGAACAAFLAASVFCLPIVLLRRTALERRLARLPHAAAVVILLSIVVASSVVVVAYLRAPAAFI